MEKGSLFSEETAGSGVGKEMVMVGEYNKSTLYALSNVIMKPT
jgi:hypothetical protein